MWRKCNDGRSGYGGAPKRPRDAGKASAKTARSQSATPTSSRRSGRERLLEGFTILAIDDEADSRALLVHLLEAEGAVVHAVENAPLAMEHLAEQPVDAIVSDIGLPGMDGLELMRAVRSHAKYRMPAVALTAYTRSFDRTAALRAGFQAHVPKPADAEELVTVLASLLGRITPTQPPPNGT